METIKVVSDSENQIVFLPKSCRLSEGEIIAGKLGDAVLLVPREKAWETFINGLNHVPDDFLPNGREPQEPAVRDVT